MRRMMIMMRRMRRRSLPARSHGPRENSQAAKICSQRKRRRRLRIFGYPLMRQFTGILPIQNQWPRPDRGDADPRRLGRAARAENRTGHPVLPAHVGLPSHPGERRAGGRTDLEAFFERIAPEDPHRYAHDDEGPDDMPAHIRAALDGGQPVDSFDRRPSRARNVAGGLSLRASARAASARDRCPRVG